MMIDAVSFSEDLLIQVLGEHTYIHVPTGILLGQNARSAQAKPTAQ